MTWHRARHVDDRDLIDAYFDTEAFDGELAALPGDYAPPAGALVLARDGKRPVGCVAMKAVDESSCEMKRMFVEPEVHGRGVGTALAVANIDAARTAGYRTMLLDTSIRQTEAQRLYRKLGFVETSAYYSLPPELADWLVFMRMDLSNC